MEKFTNKVLSEEEVNAIANKQQKNLDKFKDIFDKIEELSSLTFRDDSEKIGAQKALNILRNYLLNRDI